MGNDFVGFELTFLVYCQVTVCVALFMDSSPTFTLLALLEWGQTIFLSSIRFLRYLLCRLNRSLRILYFDLPGFV